MKIEVMGKVAPKQLLEVINQKKKKNNYNIVIQISLWADLSSLVFVITGRRIQSLELEKRLRGLGVVS